MVPPITEEVKPLAVLQMIAMLPLHEIPNNFQVQRTRNLFSVVFSELASRIFISS